ncbi:unnamed protein product [Arctogadus glacialis]
MKGIQRVEAHVVDLLAPHPQGWRALTSESGLRPLLCPAATGVTPVASSRSSARNTTLPATVADQKAPVL